MLKTAIFIGFILSFLLPSLIYAKVTTNIEVNNNAENSTNRVEVKSNSSSTTTNTSSDCHTEIRIENNGEKKEYISDDCKDVKVESSNGNNSVNITNTEKSVVEKDSPTDPTHTPTPTSPVSATPTPSPKETGSDEPRELSLVDIFLTMGKRFFTFFSLE